MEAKYSAAVAGHDNGIGPVGAFMAGNPPLVLSPRMSTAVIAREPGSAVTVLTFFAGRSAEAER